MKKEFMKLNLSITDSVDRESYASRVRTALKELGVDIEVRDSLNKALKWSRIKDDRYDEKYVSIDIPESVLIKRLGDLARFIDKCRLMRLRIVFEPTMFSDQPNEYDLEFYNTYRE